MFESSFLLFKKGIRDSSKLLSRPILIIIDSSLVIFGQYLCFNNSPIDAKFSISILIISLFIYLFSGQYKSISRFIGNRELYSITGRNLFLFLIIFLYEIFNNQGIKNLPGLIFYLTFITSSQLFIRLIIRDFIYPYIFKRKIGKTPVAIYGGGKAGAILARSIMVQDIFKLRFFIDDNKNLWGRTINGIEIISPKEALKRKNFEKILLAIPSINRKKRRELIDNLRFSNIPILTIPSIDDITSGLAKIEDLRPIKIEDLLGRDKAEIISSITKSDITESIVCVTGAGGSIGSELCKEILKQNPKLLILFERSEPNLYAILQELKELKYQESKIKGVLGCCLDKKLIHNTFKNNKVDIIFHASAHKHVPIVENNPLEGIKNNIFSTWNICKSAFSLNAKKVILISTDKAVRPTNVMGASKRVSEQIIQFFSMKSKLNNNTDNTLFTAVRFGNVLGSSGSVVPLFIKQLKKGGPITITHPEVIRYFMTINEAAQLLIASSNLSQGGEIFLLDMGEPVKIYDLAKYLIKLSGQTLKDSENINGDVEIIVSGLRPGEKLFEELLIDGVSEKTIHPLIFRANERFDNKNQFSSLIKQLELAVYDQNEELSLKLLSKMVVNWKKRTH